MYFWFYTVEEKIINKDKIVCGQLVISAPGEAEEEPQTGETASAFKTSPDCRLSLNLFWDLMNQVVKYHCDLLNFQNKMNDSVVHHNLE